MNRQEIPNKNGINHWILEKGSSIARLAKREYNDSIAYIGEEPSIIENWKKDDRIAPLIFWNNIWASPNPDTLLRRYIELDG